MTNALSFLDKLVGPTTIGMLIRAFRTLHDLTQDELARKLAMKKSYISDLENDRKPLSLKQIIKIAKALHEPVNLYIRIWTEQNYREAGIKFQDIVEVRPISSSKVFEKGQKKGKVPFPLEVSEKHPIRRTTAKKTTIRKKV